MTTLTRLKDVATLPEDQLDSFKTAPNSDVGNELIMSYLIGLIQTEDDINEFCNMVEKMIGGDPSKCECVTQLRNGKTCTYIITMHAHNVHAYVRMCACTYIYMYVCTYVCTCVCTSMPYTYAHIHTHII